MKAIFDNKFLIRLLFMEKVNFIEIAKVCQEQSRVNHTVWRNMTRYEEYVDTLFVSISEENIVTCSCISNVLENAKQCILIHSYKKLAEYVRYTWYDINYIDPMGNVWHNRLDANHKLYVDKSGCYANQVMYLRRDDDNSGILYSCDTPWNDKMQTVWDVYMKIRDCSLQEAKMVASLAMKDNKIALQAKRITELEATKLYLEQEVAVYKSILGDIKSLLKNNETIKK